MAQNSVESSELLIAINQLRARGCMCPSGWQEPVPSVRYEPLLSVSSDDHAEDLQRLRRLSHYSSSGEDIGQRVSKTGYEWALVGENLAYGQTSVREVMHDWIQSDAHCTLLMDERFEEVGYAYLRPYWVLHFGVPKP